MLKFVNLTPHPVRIIGPDGQVLEIPPSGHVPRVVEEEVDQMTLTEGLPFEIPVVFVRQGAVAGLPPIKGGEFYLVSRPVAAAIAAGVAAGEIKAEVAFRFLVPDEFVRDESGNVVGCKRFASIVPLR